MVNAIYSIKNVLGIILFVVYCGKSADAKTWMVLIKLPPGVSIPDGSDYSRNPKHHAIKSKEGLSGIDKNTFFIPNKALGDKKPLVEKTGSAIFGATSAINPKTFFNTFLSGGYNIGRGSKNFSRQVRHYSSRQFYNVLDSNYVRNIKDSLIEEAKRTGLNLSSMPVDTSKDTPITTTPKSTKPATGDKRKYLTRSVTKSIKRKLNDKELPAAANNQTPIVRRKKKEDDRKTPGN